jgi:hypothetical protein
LRSLSIDRCSGRETAKPEPADSVSFRENDIAI